MRLRGFVFCPGGSAVWLQCWLCAVCAVGHISCCVGGEYPVGVNISSPLVYPFIRRSCSVVERGYINYRSSLYNPLVVALCSDTRVQSRAVIGTTRKQCGRTYTLAFTRYCHHQYCIVYGIKNWGSVGGRTLRNGRAIVLQQGRLCRWGGQYKDG